MATPPDRTAELLSTLRSLMLPLQAASGFLGSRLCRDADRPEVICYIEEWQTSDDLDQQIRSRHYTRLLSVMEAASEPPELRLSWMTDIKGLEYLEKVRLGKQAPFAGP